MKSIWTPPDHPEIGLFHITNAKDLVTWAHWMGHSGARYQHWAIDVPIWHFLTFLDKEGYPHCTIHLKDTEWLYRKHPDDDKALAELDWDGWKPSAQDKDGKAKWWLKSTAYEHVEFKYPRPVRFNGKVCAVMGAGHRDRDPMWMGEEFLFSMWYNDVVIPESKPIARIL